MKTNNANDLTVSVYAERNVNFWFWNVDYFSSPVHIFSKLAFFFAVQVEKEKRFNTERHLFLYIYAKLNFNIDSRYKSIFNTSKYIVQICVFFFLLVRLKRKTKWISNDRYSFPYVYMEPVFVFYSQNKSIPHPKLIWREQWILSLFFSRKKMRKFRTMVNVHFYKYRGNRFQFHFSLKKIYSLSSANIELKIFGFKEKRKTNVSQLNDEQNTKDL